MCLANIDCSLDLTRSAKDGSWLVWEQMNSLLPRLADGRERPLVTFSVMSLKQTLSAHSLELEVTLSATETALRFGGTRFEVAAQLPPHFCSLPSRKIENFSSLCSPPASSSRIAVLLLITIMLRVAVHVMGCSARESYLASDLRSYPRG